MTKPQSNIRVIGLGQCSLDILGEVDHYPNVDQKAQLGSLLIQGGGPVATALVCLARLGISTAFVGAVGDDEFGELIQQGLLAEEVDCKFLKKCCKASSQVAFITVDSCGHRNIFWHRGDVVPEIPTAFEAVLSSGVEVLHLDGLHQSAAIKAAEMARTLGVTTVLDAGTFRDGMDALLPLIDHLVTSEKFAHQITGLNDPQKALFELAGYGAESVTITCGREGAYSLDSKGAIIHQPAFRVRVVDTTGCGDVFHGGYIYGLLQGWALPQRVRFAAACAALKTRALGGRTAIPTLQEVKTFMYEQRKV